MIWILIVIGLVMGLSWLFPGNADSTEEWMPIIYAAAWLVFLGGGFGARYAGKRAQMLRDIGIWVVIALVLMAGYTYRYAFTRVLEETLGSAAPSIARQNDAGEIVLRKAEGGHFFVDAQVMNKTVRFMVDTGATRVVLTPSDAARIGFDLDNLQFNMRSNTANGTVWGAAVRIDQMRVGGAYFEDIPASINGAEMSHSLLGMSFLEQLSGYRVEGDRLILVP